MESYGHFESSENTNKQDCLISFEKVEGTPFAVWGTEEKSHVLFGKYRLTEEMPKAKAIEDAKRVDMDRVVQLISVMIDFNENDKLTNKEK